MAGLKIDGNDAFLLADKNLDVQPYNTQNISITWGTSTLRTWLNSTFLIVHLLKRNKQ